MKTVQKAQAGLEYLMTYGWAMIVIITIASMLFYIFGPPKEFISFSSSNPLKIVVKAGNVSANRVEILATNATAGNITITSMVPNGYSNCTVNGKNPPFDIGAGNIIQVNCDAPPDSIGCVLLKYTDKDNYQKKAVLYSSKANQCPDTQLFESYSLYNDIYTAYSTNWIAQTFTPSTSHRITNLRLPLRRTGNPGNFIISVRNTVGGSPTGGDLCSATLNASQLTDQWIVEWKEINLSGTCNLAAGTEYAIVVRAPAGDLSNVVWWYMDNTSPTYLNGNGKISNDSGTTWPTPAGAVDFMFEEYGV